jgi:dolichyl-phosphate beta-glucosyltransferase
MHKAGRAVLGTRRASQYLEPRFPGQQRGLLYARSNGSSAELGTQPGRHHDIPQWLERERVDLEVIIPAFNEEGRLPKTITVITDYLVNLTWSSAIVIVDNNCVDRTVEIVDGLPSKAVKIHVIGCSDQGKGAAVRRGFLTSSARFVGFIDADNATPFGTLSEIIELLEMGHAAVVASRRFPGAKYLSAQPLLRRAGGLAFCRLAHLAVPGVADTQCGFKFFDGALARRIAADCHIDGFAFDVEMLARVAWSGHHIIEVPVAWSDRPGSTFSLWRDGLRSMADVVRVVLHGGAGGRSF